MNEICSFMSENRRQNGSYMLSIWKTLSATWRPSWIEISKWGYVHQWAPIENVYAWPCPGHIIMYWDLAAEPSILTKFKIGPTAAILDRTKILLDVHQGPTIGHDCAQYEWDPFIHSWEWAAESFPYVKYMEIVICHWAAILDWNFKTRLRASMGYYRQCLCMTKSRSHY